MLKRTKTIEIDSGSALQWGNDPYEVVKEAGADWFRQLEAEGYDAHIELLRANPSPYSKAYTCVEVTVGLTPKSKVPEMTLEEAVDWMQINTGHWETLCNPQHAYWETIEEYLERHVDDVVSSEFHNRAVDANVLWEVNANPYSPSKGCRSYGTTLLEALAEMRKLLVGEKD